MIHYLQYQAYVAKDKDIAILNLQKKWFQDWFNVFDLYKIAKVNYCTTIRIPYTSEEFQHDVIAKFYVTGVIIQNNMVQLQVMFFQSENPWLNSNSQMLGQVNFYNKQDYLLTMYIPIAEVIQDDQHNYSEMLDYVCNTFNACVDQQFSIQEQL